jgi:hypothetical protein
VSGGMWANRSDLHVGNIGTGRMSVVGG